MTEQAKHEPTPTLLMLGSEQGGTISVRSLGDRLQVRVTSITPANINNCDLDRNAARAIRDAISGWLAE